MSDEPQHLDFPDKVVYRLVYVSETADFLAGQMALRCHEVFVFGHESQLVGLGG